MDSSKIDAEVRRLKRAARGDWPRVAVPARPKASAIDQIRLSVGADVRIAPQPIDSKEAVEHAFAFLEFGKRELPDDIAHDDARVLDAAKVVANRAIDRAWQEWKALPPCE